MPSAITRTSMIDDDGSGTTGTIINNAWKTEFYNQIDALAGGTVGTWTPLDFSGAGLTLTVAGAKYCQIGKVVLIMGHLSYPANSNGLQAAISGLPVANGNLTGGFYSTYLSAHSLFLPANVSYFQPYNPTSGSVRTNAELSGHVVLFSGFYLSA